MPSDLQAPGVASSSGGESSARDPERDRQILYWQQPAQTAGSGATGELPAASEENSALDPAMC